MGLNVSHVQTFRLTVPHVVLQDVLLVIMVIVVAVVRVVVVTTTVVLVSNVQFFHLVALLVILVVALLVVMGIPAGHVKYALVAPLEVLVIPIAHRGEPHVVMGCVPVVVLININLGIVVVRIVRQKPVLVVLVV